MNPSYLFKTSVGIYYFRVRIPNSIRIQYNTNKKEIRKSLNTRDTPVALKSARRLWVQMEDTDYGMNDIEQELQEDNEGRKLLKQLLLADMQTKQDSYFRDYDLENDLDSFIGSLSGGQQRLLNQQLEHWNQLSQAEKDKAIAEITPAPVAPVPTPAPIPGQAPTGQVLVADKIKEFLTYHFGRKKRSGKPAPIATIKEYETIYDEFLLIVGTNLLCSELNKQIVKDYEKTIWKIPANYKRKKRYKGKGIKEILEMDIPENDLRSPATFNKHIMRVKQFLKWGGREEYIKQGLEDFIETLPDKVSANEKRDSFTDIELRLLFNNEIYEQGRVGRKLVADNPSRYWLPLLALFTGARGEELAQLYTDDITKESGIDIIQFRANKERNQGLKTSSATRVVPIHPQLIKLGFLVYVNSQKKESMLFPELESFSGKFFKKFGNNFNRKSASGWKWKCGVKRNKTTFHSFRHNVVDFYAKSNVPERVACSIVGHQPKGGGLVANYIKPSELRELEKGVKALRFPAINWRKIQKLRW